MVQLYSVGVLENNNSNLKKTKNINVIRYKERTLIFVLCSLFCCDAVPTGFDTIVCHITSDTKDTWTSHLSISAKTHLQKFYWNSFKCGLNILCKKGISCDFLKPNLDIIWIFLKNKNKND